MKKSFALSAMLGLAAAIDMVELEYIQFAARFNRFHISLGEFV